MNKEKQQLLYDKYPEIFKDKDLPMSKTCMCWGIDVGDGWFDIVENICNEIMKLHEKTGIQFIADQVKEKYGGLRFYIHDDGRLLPLTNDERTQHHLFMDSFITSMEELSETTCEICGAPGINTNSGWSKTRCDACIDK